MKLAIQENVERLLMVSEKVKQHDKLDQQIFALIDQGAMCVQERQPLVGCNPGALFQQVQLKQHPGVRAVQCEGPLQGLQRLLWTILFVEINQREIAMYRW